MMMKKRGGLGGGGLIHSAVMNAVNAVGGQNYPPRAWSTPWFAFWEDCPACVEATFCSCCLIGYQSANSSIWLEDFDCGAACLSCVFFYFCANLGLGLSAMTIRGQIKAKYNVSDQGVCDDCCVPCFCWNCALAQHSAHLTAIGDHHGSMCVSKNINPQQQPQPQEMGVAQAIPMQPQGYAGQQPMMMQPGMQPPAFQQQQPPPPGFAPAAPPPQFGAPPPQQAGFGAPPPGVYDPNMAQAGAPPGFAQPPPMMMQPGMQPPQQYS